MFMWFRSSLLFLLLTFFLLLIGTEGKAQGEKLLFQVNYATFHMRGMKEMQNDFAEQIKENVDAKVLSSFPAYSGYELNFNTEFAEGHQIGGYVGYYSTGGRIHYEDYSGEIKMDQLLKNVSAGVYNELSFYNLAESDFIFSFRAGITLTQYQIISLLQVEKIAEKEDIGFNSINIHLSPGICYRYPIGKIFFVQAEARYELHAPGSLRLNSDKDAKLIDSKGDEIKAHWDGFRLGISIGASFLPQK